MKLRRENSNARTRFVAAVAFFLLLTVVAAADSHAQTPAPSQTPAAQTPTQTRAPARDEGRTGATDQRLGAQAGASPEEADLSITAHVTARELLFRKVPNPKVEFPGRPERQTAWEAERENLPEQVQPGVTYRDIGIRLRITSVFADIERIVAEALGEVPASEDAAPPQPRPDATPRPVTEQPPGPRASAPPRQTSPAAVTTPSNAPRGAPRQRATRPRTRR